MLSYVTVHALNSDVLKNLLGNWKPIFTVQLLKTKDLGQ